MINKASKLSLNIANIIFEIFDDRLLFFPFLLCLKKRDTNHNKDLARI